MFFVQNELLCMMSWSIKRWSVLLWHFAPMLIKTWRLLTSKKMQCESPSNQAFHFCFLHIIVLWVLCHPNGRVRLVYGNYNADVLLRQYNHTVVAYIRASMLHTKLLACRLTESLFFVILWNCHTALTWMEHLLSPLDLSHVQIWKKSPQKVFGAGEQNLEHDNGSIRFAPARH